jgi:hypothetical protein
LNETQKSVQQDNGEDGAGIDPFPEQAGDDRSADQHPDNQAGELRPQDRPRGRGRGFRQFITAVHRQAARSVILAQPLGQAHIKRPREFLG